MLIFTPSHPNRPVTIRIGKRVRHQATSANERAAKRQQHHQSNGRRRHAEGEPLIA